MPQNRFGSKPTRADSSEEGVRRVYLTPRGWRRSVAPVRSRCPLGGCPEAAKCSAFSRPHDSRNVLPRGQRDPQVTASVRQLSQLRNEDNHENEKPCFLERFAVLCAWSRRWSRSATTGRGVSCAKSHHLCVGWTSS